MDMEASWHSLCCALQDDDDDDLLIIDAPPPSDFRAPYVWWLWISRGNTIGQTVVLYTLAFMDAAVAMIGQSC